MPPPLDYAPRVAIDRRGVVGVLISFAALATSIGLAARSFWHMDGQRLMWEGGYQYFRERFPLGWVLGLAVAALVSALFSAVVARPWRRAALMTAGCAIFWAAWWGRHLLR